MKETEENKSVENTNEMPERGLSTELLSEIKAQSKRWANAFFVVLLLWFLTIGVFLLYLYQYDFSSYTIQSESEGNANYIGGDGDINNGENSSSEASTEEP